MKTQTTMKTRLSIAALITVLCSLQCAAQQDVTDVKEEQPAPAGPSPDWPPPPVPTPAPSTGPDSPEPVVEDRTVRHVTVELVDGSLLFGTLQAETTFPLQAEKSKMNIAIKWVESIAFSGNGKKAVIEMRNGDRLEGVPGPRPLALKALFGRVELDLRHIKSVSVRDIDMPELVFRDSSGNGRAEFLSIPARIGERETIATKKTFKPPLEITIVAKTNSTNLRIWYTAGAIFNWELDPNQLRFDLNGQNQGNGAIPTGKYVTVRWVVTAHGQKIYVDGQLRHEDRKDYSRTDSPVVIYQHSNAVVTLKSIKIEPLPTE